MGFRKTGTVYVRKDGNNDNDGLSPSTPKQTISAGSNVGTGKCIVMAGTYVEAPIAKTEIEGDGIVILQAPTPGVSEMTSPKKIQNVSIRDFLGFLGTPGQLYMSRCILYSCGIMWTNMDYCTIVGSYIKPGNTGAVQATNSIFVDTRIVINASSSTYSPSYCYIDYYSALYSLKSSLANHVVGNCIEGILGIDGVNYACPKAIDIIDENTVRPFAQRQGTYPPDATDWIHVGLAQTPKKCYVDNRNFNASPQFTDPANYDFTVAPTSPFINRLGIGQNLCGVMVADRKVNAADMAKTNLSGTNDLTVESPYVRGEAVSGVITIDAVQPRTIDRLRYVGNLSFDKTQAGGTAGNDNVPKAATYTKNGVSVTSTSPRPSVLIRWTTRTDRTPITDADWTNDNASGVLPGEWVLAELNEEFKIDINGWGNGDERFDHLNAYNVQATYMQIKAVLTDEYTYG